MTSPYFMYNIASPIINISWKTNINEQYLHSEHDPSAGNKLALYNDHWLFTERLCHIYSVQENPQRTQQLIHELIHEVWTFDGKTSLTTEKSGKSSKKISRSDDISSKKKVTKVTCESLYFWQINKQVWQESWEQRKTFKTAESAVHTDLYPSNSGMINSGAGLWTESLSRNHGHPHTSPRLV